MQEEVMKHTRKIYKALKSSKYLFAEKSKEVVIEIFIIVFSVTISIWLHSWSLHRHQQKETTEFLTDLKDDLNKDIESMSEKSAQMSRTITEYTFLRNLTEGQIDSMAAVNGQVGFNLYPVIRKTNSGNYEGFKSSGKIGYIENKKLKKLILDYYQESMPSIEETEIYYNSRLTKIEDLIYQDKEKKEKLLDPVLKTAFYFVILTAQNNNRNYDEVIKSAKEIISEIDKKGKE